MRLSDFRLLVDCSCFIDLDQLPVLFDCGDAIFKRRGVLVLAIDDEASLGVDVPELPALFHDSEPFGKACRMVELIRNRQLLVNVDYST